MKKAFFAIVFAFIGIITAQAQWYIGGSINGNLGKETKTLNMVPDVGYYFSDNSFALGCEFEYNLSFLEGEGTSHSLDISPYGTLDICDISERFSLFLDIITSFDALSFNYFEIGLSPGVAFSLTEHWEAVFNFGYIGYLWEHVPDGKANHNFVMDYKPSAGMFRMHYYF